MRFTINLATRIYLDHRLLNRYAAAVSVVLFVVLAWNISRYSNYRGEVSRLNGEIAAMESKLGGESQGVSEAEAVKRKKHIRFFNGIIAQKSKNWISLLGMFENVTPEGIALTSLTPGKSSGEWKIDGIARNFRAVQNYLEKLESSPDFNDVLLQSHSMITLNPATHGVQFSLTCKVTHQ